MRGLMAAAAFTTILFVGAGCGEDKASGSNPSGNATTSTVDVAANTKQVCADVKKLNTDSAKKINDTINQALMAPDQASGEKLMAELNTVTKDWVGKLQAQSAKAANADLAKALSDLATEVKKLESADANLNQMNEILKNANQKLATYCG